MSGTLLSISYALIQFFVLPLNSLLCFGRSVAPKPRSFPCISICHGASALIRIDHAVFQQWNHPSHCRPQGPRPLLLFSAHDSRDIDGCQIWNHIQYVSLAMVDKVVAYPQTIGCFCQKGTWRLSSPISLLYRLRNWGLEPWSHWLKVREDWELELGIKPECFVFKFNAEMQAPY